MASSLNSPLLLLISLLVSVTYLFLRWSKYISELNWQSKDKTSNFNIKDISIKGLQGLGIFIIYGLCMRGGVQLAPINQSFAFYSKEPALNAAAVNTIYNCFYSYAKKKHINPYNYFTKNELDSLLIKINDGKEVVIMPKKITDSSKRLWGMNRSLLNTDIIGTSVGYQKILELSGVGFRAALKGNQINLQLGFSHDINFDIPQGIKMTVEKQTTIKISGYDKQQVGMVASQIKSLIPPEPYK